MDFYLFEITIESELDGNFYRESGVLYAEDYEEALHKIRATYAGDSIAGLNLQYYTSDGVCILTPPQSIDEESLFDGIEGGRTYTVNMKDIS